MPPKPTQTKPPIKTTPKPSIKPNVPPKSIPNLKNPTTSDLPNSNDLQTSNRATPMFDLNEPWSEDAQVETRANEDKIGQVPIKEEKKKQKEFEVFVGGLDRDAVEEDLEKVFNKVGEIVEVRLVKSKFSHKNKGFAFVRFATIDQAKRAAHELNYTQSISVFLKYGFKCFGIVLLTWTSCQLVRGKVCEVTRNNDNETLHIGNICTTWTKDMLVEKLRPFELENLEEVLLIEDPSDKRKNRGYAFLNFSTHMDALAACQRLQKGNIYFGTAVRADIAFAKSAVEPDEEIMAQVKSVFLDGVPPSWDEEQVQEYFKIFGKIDNIELARNMPSAKRKDFGFISFSTREAALSCIDVVNKDGIGEGARKVQLKASLRKPLQKRISSTGGSWRGYGSNSYGDWSSRSRGTDRSYHSRQSRAVESFGRDSDREFSGYSRHSTRGVFQREQSPVEKYGSQLRKRSFQQGPVSATARSRSRDPYAESSSYNRHSRTYRDFPSSYTQATSHEHYEDDVYDSQYEYYEKNSPDTYDYPAPSRLKRAYATIDNDPLMSRSLTKHARSGAYGLDVDAYPLHGHEEYSRNTPEDYYEYDSSVYSSRYLSGSGASQSYRY